MAANSLRIMASPEYYTVLAPWIANAPNRPQTLLLDDLRLWMSGETQPIAGTLLQPVSADGVPAEWVSLPGARRDIRILYLHGGGYISGSPLPYREFTSELSQATNAVLLAPDYRLGPEHPFPAAVEDAVTAYRWMRRNDPAGTADGGHTFIMGDSAGGGLTLATLLALRDAGDPLPDGAITISAYTDLAHTGASVQTRAEADLVNRPSWLSVYAGNYLCGADPRHPLASPLYADFAGLPPLLLQVGDAETIRDDTTRVAEKARVAGVEVTCEVWPEMIHVWHLRKPSFPEAREAVAHIVSFIEAIVAAKRQDFFNRRLRRLRRRNIRVLSCNADACQSYLHDGRDSGFHKQP